MYQLDPLDRRAVADAVSALAPDEIYMLSGQSSVGLSFQNPAETFASIADATVHVLDSLRTVLPRARLFCAGSSECFGSREDPAEIGTPFAPVSPYSIAKCAAYWAVAVYRRAYGLFATTGILYNHESPLRPPTYVTRKIVSAAIRIADKNPQRLTLGNLNIVRDWGWSPEYVEAMHRMLQRDEPEDYIIATGESRPLHDFVSAVFGAVGLNWRDHVDISTDMHRPSETLRSYANIARTRSQLGWMATTRFDNLIHKLVTCEQSGTLG
jgi:GDPmannose 4,6-dehydratase